MFCARCGNQMGEGQGFCPKCGSQVGAAQGSQPAPVTGSFAPPRPTSPGNTFSIIGLICGAVAFLFLPVVFGPAGLILGGIGKSKGESLAVRAMIVSGAGLILGMILGFLVFASI